MGDIESIHIICWEKDDTYDLVLINEKVGGKVHSQLLIYNVVVRKLTYEETYWN